MTSIADLKWQKKETLSEIKDKSIESVQSKDQEEKRKKEENMYPAYFPCMLNYFINLPQKAVLEICHLPFKAQLKSKKRAPTLG